MTDTPLSVTVCTDLLSTVYCVPHVYSTCGVFVIDCCTDIDCCELAWQWKELCSVIQRWCHCYLQKWEQTRQDHSTSRYASSSSFSSSVPHVVIGSRTPQVLIYPRSQSALCSGTMLTQTHCWCSAEDILRPMVLVLSHSLYTVHAAHTCLALWSRYWTSSAYHLLLLWLVREGGRERER